MASYENFYSGADYGLDPEYNKKVESIGSLGITIDGRTANQLKEVSAKLSTGAKVIEVQGVSAEVFESIPNQHLDEMNKLRKLVGAELTLHGPIVEPTGIGEKGWSEYQREQSERQMWSAVERSNRIDPKGNIIVTFHTSAGIPVPRERVWTKDGEEVTTNLAVVDERTGRFGMLPKPTKEHLTDESDKINVENELKKLNKNNWTQALSNLGISVSRGREAVAESLSGEEEIGKKVDSDTITKFYKQSIENPEQFQKDIDDLGKKEPLFKKELERQIQRIDYGNIFARDAHNQFKELFNQAWDASKDNPEEMEKLKKLKKEISQTFINYEEKPSNMQEVINAVSKGIRVLNTFKEAPKVFKPLEDFAVDKASETFSNVAFKAYNKFGKHAPIISIENPPAGMGLARADEMKKLIEASREKFVEKAVEKGLSKGEAKEQAEKLIGATWDVGHINMIRKYGAEEKHLLAETKTIAPFVKHVHFSDNFGMEHTEMPMGMGNVPTDKEMKIIKQYNDKVKKIIEASPPHWYRDFGVNPLAVTARGLGSPMYAGTSGGATWAQSGMMAGYWSGQGPINPEFHHQIYGSGFANLPTELGGQVAGRNRLSGAPTE